MLLARDTETHNVPVTVTTSSKSGKATYPETNSTCQKKKNLFKNTGKVKVVFQALVMSCFCFYFLKLGNGMQIDNIQRGDCIEMLLTGQNCMRH